MPSLENCNTKGYIGSHGNTERYRDKGSHGDPEGEKGREGRKTDTYKESWGYTSSFLSASTWFCEHLITNFWFLQLF